MDHKKIKQLYENGILTKDEMERELNTSTFKHSHQKKWVVITALTLVTCLIIGYFIFLKDYNLENCQTPQNLSLVISSEGRIYYVTKSEWKKMSILQKKEVLKIGLVIKTDDKEFMIDPYDYPDGAVDWHEAMRHKYELPNKGQAEIIVKHRFAIDEALEYFGLDGLNTHYWTSSLKHQSWYGSRAWGFGISLDFLFDDQIDSEHLLRFVRPIPQGVIPY